MQQNINPLPTSETMEIEIKIMLLYLIDKMKAPMTYSLVTQFAVENNYVNHYNAQIFLDEMVEAGYIEKLEDNNITHYAITSEGETAIEAFPNQLSPALKEKINKFVSENRNNAKREFDITANYFYQPHNNEYLVKCVAFEDDIPLMELNLSVVTKEQAVSLCNNWKNNIDSIYGDILQVLTKKRTKKDPE